MRVVDLRSDTLTQPSPGMKEAMVSAPLGDDVFGEDPTVIALQDKVATLLGKEAALFVPTGTMGNLICVLTHCRTRGSEVLLGNLSHIHVWEQGGISQLGGVHPRPLTNLPDGTFDLQEVRQLVRGDNVHWPVTALVCVENTHNMVGGKVVPLQWMDQLGSLCRELGLPLHMDGARVMNAATALGVPPARVVRDCDSVSLCLSKGLGAPVGSVIAGSKEFIGHATRLRKALGGGMRQVGVLAAAGIYGLDHVAPRLSQDHEHIRTIAKAVAELGSKLIKVDLEGAQTNIVLLECDLKRVTPAQVCKRMSETSPSETASVGEEVVVKCLPMTESTVRLVVHCDVSPADIPLVVRKLIFVIKEFETRV